MNPAYTLALKLGIPIIVQPAWDECHKLQEEGQKIWNEGWKLQEEWHKLLDEGRKLREEGRELYQEAVARELGSEYIDRIDWGTGEVMPKKEGVFEYV